MLNIVFMLELINQIIFSKKLSFFSLLSIAKKAITFLKLKKKYNQSFKCQ